MTALAFSPDGRRLAFAKSPELVQVWDAGTRLPLISFSENEDGAAPAVGFSPDGRQLLTTVRNRLRVWDAAPADPDERPDWHRRRTQVCIDSREWTAADAHATQAIADEPSVAAWYARRWSARLAIGRDAEAADHAHAIQLTPRRPGLIGLAGGDATVWMYRGEGFAYSGRWAEAGQAYQLALAFEPGELLHWDNRLAVALATDDLAGYHATARRLLAMLGDKPSADRADTAAGLLTAAPWDGDPAPLAALARHLSGRWPAAAMAYRLGRFADADQLFQRGDAPDRAEDMLFRTLIRHRLGDPTADRRWLERGRAWATEADRVEADPTAWGAVRWADWNERQRVRHLLAEATALVRE